MVITATGQQMYDNVEELTYNFLNAIELSVLPDGQIVDFSTMIVTQNGMMIPTSIQRSGKILKATIDPEDIKYAGENEEMLDTLGNIKQINFLLGVLLDKLQAEGRQLLSFYNEEFEDPNGNKLVSMNAKFIDGTVSSKFYYNKCLATIGLVFELAEYDVDLSNFNVPMINK